MFQQISLVDFTAVLKFSQLVNNLLLLLYFALMDDEHSGKVCSISRNSVVL